MDQNRPLLIANKNCSELQVLAELLGADFLGAPDFPAAFDNAEQSDWAWSEDLQQWRDQSCNGNTYAKIVVAIWQDEPAAKPLIEMNLNHWVQNCEAPIAWWTASLGSAQALCIDGGAVVSVIDQPTVLDSENWTERVTVEETVAALTKSLARSEGGRGVRFNAVTTPSRISRHQPLVDPQPPLKSFPGTIEKEVIGAVKLLLDDNASGLSGRVLNVDCGRSL